MQRFVSFLSVLFIATVLFNGCASGQPEVGQSEDGLMTKAEFDALRKKAEAGDTYSLFELAGVYADGADELSIKKDAKKAVELIDKGFAIERKSCKTPKDLIELVEGEIGVYCDDISLSLKPSQTFEKLHIKDCPKDFQDAFEKAKPIFAPLFDELNVVSEKTEKLTGGKSLSIVFRENGVAIEIVGKDGKDEKIDPAVRAKLERLVEQECDLTDRLYEALAPLRKIAGKYGANIFNPPDEKADAPDPLEK